MNIESSKLDVEYEKEVGFAILMIPVSFFLMFAGLLNWDTFFVFIGFIFAWVLYSYIRSLGYMFLVDKKLSIEATYEYLSWKIFDNDVLVNDTRIYKKDIKYIYIEVHYSDGSYNYTTLTFTMHSHKNIVLKDDHTFSYGSNYEKITDHIIEYGYSNNFIANSKPKSNTSYDLSFKTDKRVQILKDALKKRYKQTKAILYYLRYIFYISAIYLVLNPILNYVSLQNNVFDGEFKFIQDTSKAINITPSSMSVKILKDDEYFYTLYKKDKRYYILKQREFSLGQTYLTLYDKMDFEFLYEKLKDDIENKKIFQNISRLVYRQIDTWEYIVKPLYLSNDISDIFSVGTISYVRRFEKSEKVAIYLEERKAQKEVVYKKMLPVMTQTLDYIAKHIVQNKYSYSYISKEVEEFESNSINFNFKYKKIKKYQDIKKLLQVWKKLSSLQSNIHKKFKTLSTIILNNKRYYYQYEAYMPHITYSQTFLSLVKDYKRFRKDKIILSQKLNTIAKIHSHNQSYDYINIGTKYKKMYFFKSDRTKALDIYNDMYKSSLLYIELKDKLNSLKKTKYLAK